MPPLGYRRTHCRNGHEFTDDNIYINSVTKQRGCLECRTRYSKKLYKDRAEQVKEQMRQERKDNPDKFRTRELWRCHKLTPERYDEMLAEQGGVCKGCGRTPEKERYRRLSVDHDHACCPQKRNTCGKCVRGLLCGDCNKAIGSLKDSPELLRRLADYIESYRKQ